MADIKSEIRVTTKEDFFPEVIKMHAEQWRLVQICAVSVEGGYEMNYSFCKDYQMVTLRILLAEDEKISSITSIYACAFLQENEAAELFGVKIENMNLDYQSKLYRIDVETPFKGKE